LHQEKEINMALPQFSLEGKIAIVTGGGQGIGKEIAVTFAQAGAHLVIADINRETAEETARQITSLGREALAVQVDVRDMSQIEDMINRTLEEFERLDIMVNNAGFGHLTVPLVEMAEQDWDNWITLNLKSTFLCCKAAGKIMIRQGTGNIINMSSMAALGAYPTGVNYSAAKAGIKNLTETLAVELGPYNIRVNALAPGIIETFLTKSLYQKHPHLKEQRLKNIPLGRTGTPEDVANTALFLACDASSYISGQTIAINGAMATFVQAELISDIAHKFRE